MIAGPLSSGSKSHGRTLIALLTLCSLATAGAVWWYYTRQLSAMEAQVIHELRAVSETKTQQVANWRAERLGDGHALMNSYLMGIAERVLTGHAAAADTAYLTEILTRMDESFLYTGAALCDLDGKPHMIRGQASTDPARWRDLAQEIAGAGDSRLSDLRLDPQSGRPLMALILPVRKKGVLILDIDPERFLYPYLRSWSGHSSSAETLLMRRDGNFGQYLSDLRYHANAPLRFRRDISHLDLPPDSTLEAGTGAIYRSTDYRSKPVIAILRHIPGSPWYINAKIDSDEADAPERRLGWEMAIVTGLIALVNVTGAIVVWRGQNARSQKEKLDWFHSVANDTPAYLWMADPKMEHSFINATFSRFLGTNDSFLRDAWTASVHPDDAERARQMFRSHMEQKTGYTQEYRLRRHDGEYRWVVSTAVPRFAENGQFLGFAGSVLDLTGRRLAEQRLREANDRLQVLSTRLIGAQEDERKRLARELHDDLSQQIAAISIAAGNLKRRIPEDNTAARTQVDAIHEELVELGEGVRRLSHELHPAVLQYSGLAAALRSYCEEFGTLTGIRVAVDIQGSFEGVWPDAALCLFRVAQEGLRNVARHAQVSQATVELRRADGLLHLTISDKGAGMETCEPGARGGLGLLNIQERARLVGGKVAIRSSPGNGTNITVEVPEKAVS